MRFASSLAFFFALPLAFPGGSPAAFCQSSDLSRSTQLLVVTTPDWNTIEGHLQRFERANSQDSWHPAGQPIAIVVGKSGLGWGLGLIATSAPNIGAASDP